MHRHRPVRVGFPHGHMMFRRHRSVDPHTDTHHRRRRGRSTGLALILTRGSPFGPDEEHPARLPARADTHGSSPTVGESPRTAPLTPPAGPVSPRTPEPTTTGDTHVRPSLWVIRCLPNDPRRLRAPTTQRERSIHQFPQPGLPGDGPRTAISFTSPKLTRKPPPPGSLPASPYVATAPHRGRPQVIQAIKSPGESAALTPRVL